MNSAPLLIRADASTAIGTGHVMRCIALAQAWRETGGTAHFAHASSTSALAERLAAEGFGTIDIAREAGSPADAEATVAAALKTGARWVVADGYAFGAEWQKAVRAAGLRLLLIDDYGHASHYHADVVLNQNTSADASLYAHRDTHTRLLLGPRFALLRREFTVSTGRADRTIENRPLRVLITLGGSDPDDATSVVLAALADTPGIELVVVVGGSNPNLLALREKVAAFPGSARLVVNASDMPGLMAWADAAVSASGSTVWELAHAGVSAALVVTADNQEGIARTMCEVGAVRLVGRHPGLKITELRASLAEWLADGEARAKAARIAAELVDGRGALRVRAVLADSLAITILSDADSWLQPAIRELAATFVAEGHRVRTIHDPRDLTEGGDIAFFLALGKIVPPELLARHVHNLVVHESALPHGRGWSPLTWQILEGKNEIPVTLLEASAGVDEGSVYATRTLRFAGHELVPELRVAQAAATVELCREFVSRYPISAAEGRAQVGEASYYPRRRPADSRLDPARPLIEQFNLLRVCDPDRYPAYFEHAGRRYELVLRPAASA